MLIGQELYGMCTFIGVTDHLSIHMNQEIRRPRDIPTGIVGMKVKFKSSWAAQCTR